MAASTAAYVAAALRVLLVDRSETHRSLFARRLERAGVEVVGTADDVATTVRLATALRPDVVVADDSIAGLAADVAVALREARDDVPVVAVSTWSSRADQGRLENAGVAALLAKDAPRADLLATLDLAASRRPVPSGATGPPSTSTTPVTAEVDDPTPPRARSRSNPLRSVLIAAGGAMAVGAVPVFGPQVASSLGDDGLGPVIALLLLLAAVAAGLSLPLVGQVRQRRAAEQAVRDAEASLDQLQRFVASAAHDLRTPATVVAGFSGMLRDQWSSLGVEQRQEIVASIARSSGRLSGLLDDLMTTALSHRGELQLVAERADLNMVLERAQEQSLASSLDVMRTGTTDVEVMVDERSLARVLANLLDNAVKYGAEPLRIEAETVPGRVRVRVMDHGEGVAAEFVPRLFDRLAQDDADAKHRKGGVGLGLHVVRSLSQAMGIDLRYRDDGPGATFELDIPLAAGDARPDPMSARRARRDRSQA